MGLLFGRPVVMLFIRFLRLPLLHKKRSHRWTSESKKRVKYIGSSNNNISLRLNSHIKSGKLTKK